MCVTDDIGIYDYLYYYNIFFIKLSICTKHNPFTKIELKNGLNNNIQYFHGS